MDGILRTEYHQALSELEADFQEEGSLVLRAIRGSMNALEQQDVELADEVIAFDDAIDERYHDIEKKIELILARQTPVASELRLVLAILHNSIHLERMGDQCGLGRVLLAGALILTLLVLPTVIVAAREAIRAVPDSIRQGAFALGATKWQIVSRQVLPASIPGIATGTILALSRAIGETAPLLLVGAVVFVSFNPALLGTYTVLPIQIFQWISRPQDEFKALAAAAIIVLLVMLLGLNAVAIWLRNRYQKRW